MVVVWAAFAGTVLRNSNTVHATSHYDLSSSDLDLAGLMRSYHLAKKIRLRVLFGGKFLFMQCFSPRFFFEYYSLQKYVLFSTVSVFAHVACHAKMIARRTQSISSPRTG